MPEVVITRQLREFTSLQLAQSRPTNTSPTSIYSPASGVNAEIDSIIISNQSGTASTFRIFHDEDGTTYTQATALYYDVSIAANSTIEITVPIYMQNENGNLAVRSGNANAVTYTVYGRETQIRAR